MTRYVTLSQTVLPFCFSAEILIKRLYEALRDAIDELLLNTGKIPTDLQSNDGYTGNCYEF